jgi:hypothetical protein
MSAGGVKDAFGTVFNHIIRNIFILTITLTLRILIPSKIDLISSGIPLRTEGKKIYERESRIHG